MHKQDMALVKSLLKGDRAGFTVFYDTYFPRVFRFCINRVNDEESCKDIVQQSMTNAMKSLHLYRGEASLYTWLCQISRNEIYAWHKKHSRHYENVNSIDNDPSLLAALESIPSGIGGEKLELLDHTLNDLVQTSLDSLPSAYGKVLELKYVEGLSVGDIAKLMETTDIAIQSLLARARKAFKDVFTDLEHAAGSNLHTV